MLFLSTSFILSPHVSPSLNVMQWGIVLGSIVFGHLLIYWFQATAFKYVSVNTCTPYEHVSLVYRLIVSLWVFNE